jgi:hypothetical protein
MIEETEALISVLQAETGAARAVAAQLMQGGALDDALGFLAAPPSALAPAPPVLQGWLERQAAHEGIAGLALFTDTDTWIAGELPTDADTLRRAVRLAKRRADALGQGLGHGGATSLTVETPEHTLVAFWLTRSRSLVLITRAPTWRGSRQAETRGRSARTRHPARVKL